MALTAGPGRRRRRAWQVAGAAAAAALACGCLTVDDRTLTVKPSPIDISNFENVALQPADPRFDAWQYAAYNSDAPTVIAAVVSPGFNSGWCLSIDWQVTDAPDGALNYPGVLLRTAINGSIDLNPYESVVFAHRYQNTGTCMALQNVIVRFLCRQVQFGFEKYVPVSYVWQMLSINFADLEEVPYLRQMLLDTQQDVPTKEACLAVVDEVQFLAQGDLQDGQCSSGELQLDDISIR